MTTPRCPYCNAQGLKHLEAKPVGAFTVVSCGQCGAIHGIIPKVDKEPPPKEKASFFDKLAHLGEVEMPPPVLYTPEQLAHKIQRHKSPSTNRKVVVSSMQPLCQIHQRPMEKTTIPSGYKNAGRQVWVCPYPDCQEWNLVE